MTLNRLTSHDAGVIIILWSVQVNQNLRSFGSMSRNDVQCMMYNHRDGLPSAIRNGLNLKVDQLIKVSGLGISRGRKEN